MDTITEKDALLQAKIPDSLYLRLQRLVAGTRPKIYPRDVVVAALEKYLPEAEKKAMALANARGQQR